MSRNRFFLYVTLGSAVYYFVPGYLFTALSVFNWVCWIAPNNVVVNQLFGYSTGLGFGFLTFDWSMISYIGSPLVTPWWAQANVFAVFVLFIWIVSPIMYCEFWNRSSLDSILIIFQIRTSGSARICLSRPMLRLTTPAKCTTQRWLPAVAFSMRRPSKNTRLSTFPSRMLSATVAHSPELLP
jgi:hypothetical protein